MVFWGCPLAKLLILVEKSQNFENSLEKLRNKFWCIRKDILLFILFKMTIYHEKHLILEILEIYLGRNISPLAFLGFSCKIFTPGFTTWIQVRRNFVALASKWLFWSWQLSVCALKCTWVTLQCFITQLVSDALSA